MPARSSGCARSGCRGPVSAAPAACLDVLLVADNPVNPLLVRRLLERRGHIVELAGTGRDALACARRTRHHVVLLDLHLPDRDGFAVLAALRARPESGPSHVIDLTASALASDRERCLAAGTDGFLSKPIEVRAL